MSPNRTAWSLKKLATSKECPDTKSAPIGFGAGSFVSHGGTQGSPMCRAKPGSADQDPDCAKRQMPPNGPEHQPEPAGDRLCDPGAPKGGRADILWLRADLRDRGGEELAQALVVLP